MKTIHHLAALGLSASLLSLSLAFAASDAGAPAGSHLPITPGPFRAELESLKQFRCPDWFRDAKFGIWAHWGPQSVPMMGDWYAKNMYVQGHPQYQHHLATYGHPSTNGYKEIIQRWTAEKFDPDRLMALYKKAGARYFVSMGSHHDNFFLWNSQLHRWNAVQMGPHRDIVGEWQKAARKYGLRFGVSEHLGASFTWFQTSHGADKTGPFAGVPYDGANPVYQDLYHFPAEAGDSGWYSTNPRWHRMWFDQIKELVDNYRPDLLYTDGGIPFGETGRALVAHFYNASLAHHHRLEAVYTCKSIGPGEFAPGACVQDMERGVLPGINPYPWQTDTSIGDWFFNRNWKFRPVVWTIHMLVDIVSKNGNLLLNVVQRPDGSIDPEVEQSLTALADWISVHGEAIYGTRPWQIYGEGPVRARGGHFKEDFAYTAKDIRFTTKGKTLYAIALGWPDDGRFLVRSLAKPASGSGNVIQRVELLGHRGRLPFTQTTEGLSVLLPPTRTPAYTAALRIRGKDLTPVPFEIPVEPIQPDAHGEFLLPAAKADLRGDTLGVETRGGILNLAYWDDPKQDATWTLAAVKPGSYVVTASIASPQGTPAVHLEAGGMKLTASVTRTRDWDDFQEMTLGRLELGLSGRIIVKLEPAEPASWKPVNVRWLKLTRVP